jgi:hypothetical protein
MGSSQSFASLAPVYGRSRAAQSNKEERANQVNHCPRVFLGWWERAGVANCQEGGGRAEDQLGNCKDRQ